MNVMDKNILTSGKITSKLAYLAFPIMGTSFLQMAYNIVDMIWIGKLGAGEVAAVGSAGYFLWLSFSLITLSRVGVEVIVAQKLGAKEMDEANHYAGTSMTFAVMTGLIYGLILILGRQYLIGFFKLGDSLVEAQARQYLLIVAFSMPFSLFNQVISAVYNASGQSRLPFRANAFGLVMNMVLDPLMILGLGWGVAGAAIATTVSQVFVSGMLFKLLFGVTKPYDGFHIEVILRKERLKEMLKIALPVALQNGIFTVLSMFVARIVAGFGTTAIAVQKVGTQIEAISYMTANGFGIALSAMVGQNLGAGKIDRVRSSFRSAIITMAIFGVFVSLGLFFFARPIFSVFINEEPALSMGVTYLRIISFSQLFMCAEISMAGGFNGLGKSVPPAIVSVVFNFLRIPSAFILSAYTILKLNGIWWAISFGSVLKGVTLLVILMIVLKKLTKSEATSHM